MLVASLFAAAACSGDDGSVAGADTVRSGEASMGSVRFEDVAQDVGLDFRHSAFVWEGGPDPVAMMAGGLCWFDVDRDGWLDLYAVDTWSEGEWGEWRREGGIPTSRLFRNDHGRFTDVTDEMDAAVEDRGMGCVTADLDGDGWTDLFVTTERTDVLLWNDGGDRFVDDASTSTPSGLATYGWHTGAAVGDVDGNGWADVFVAGYADTNRPDPTSSQGFPNNFGAEADLLFLNEGPVDGGRVRFREVAGHVGMEPDGPTYGLGTMLADLDEDGDLDLYVANDTQPNQLYENHGVGGDGLPRFEEIGVAAGVGDDGAGMGVASADVGDSDRFLVTTNQLAERHVLVGNASDAAGSMHFEDERATAGVEDFGSGLTGWGASWDDFDLDGDRDLALAHGSIPVRDLVTDRQALIVYASELASDRDLHLRDVSADVGLDEVGPRLGRGLAAADYDNDGDIDLAVGTIGGQLALLRNTGAGGHWVTVAFPSPVPGAVVTIRSEGGTQRRELAAGGSYLSSEDPRAHFGLGVDELVEEVRVSFPDGRTIVIDDVAADRIVDVDPEDAG